jgi:hypothetical protein
MDSASYNGICTISNLANSIADEPDSHFNQGRAEEIVRFAAAIIEREDRYRMVLEEATNRIKPGILPGEPDEVY